MTPYSAFLRVYEPLVAFPEPARAAWALYSDPDEELPDPREVLAAERRAMRERLTVTPPVLVPQRESDQALISRIDGATYICPLQTRLRSIEAYASLDTALPRTVLLAAVPPESRPRAEAEVAGWRAKGSAEQVHIKEARWHIPLPWFLLFQPAERRLVLVPEPAGESDQADQALERERQERHEEPRANGPGRALRYLTRMVEARRRLARALAVLRKTVEGSVVEDVEQLGRWLEEFHPHALVELDYGGIVEIVDDGFLVTDRSVADVAEGVAALSAGDGAAAAERYRAVALRWAAVERCESAN